MRTICVASVKGGVGKTTITCGLAKAFQRKGLLVGVLDLDYRNPECPLLLGADSARIRHGPGDTLIPPEVDGIALFSMGMVWPTRTAVLVEDDLAVKDVRQLLSPGTIAWPGGMDMLLVDSPPNSSGIVVAALAAPGISGALAVSHPSSLSIAALERTLDLFRQKGVPVYGVVSNQGSDLQGQTRYDRTDADVEALVKPYGLPIFAAIPHASHLDPYFDMLAEGLLKAQPAKLLMVSFPKARWTKLLEALR